MINTTQPITYLRQSVTAALQYADENGIEVPVSLRLRARRVMALKAADDLGGINAAYNDAIIESLMKYFEGGSLASSRSAFRRAAVEALGGAFDLGYGDGGGELPVDGDALDWLNARIEQELGFIGTVFEQAKQLKKDAEADTFTWATERAAGYVATVSALYNAGLMWAKKNQMLTWVYGDTDHCATCQELNGQKHRASWYISRDYIPRKPGASMDCGGYRCMCSLVDQSGNEVTI